MLSIMYTTAGFVCYDDGCHLKKYASHRDRKMMTATAKQLAEINIVMDKLHFFKGTRTDGVTNTVTPTRLKN